MWYACAWRCTRFYAMCNKSTSNTRITTELAYILKRTETDSQRALVHIPYDLTWRWGTCRTVPCRASILLSQTSDLHQATPQLLFNRTQLCISKHVPDYPTRVSNGQVPVEHIMNKEYTPTYSHMFALTSVWHMLSIQCVPPLPHVLHTQTIYVHPLEILVCGNNQINTIHHIPTTRDPQETLVSTRRQLMRLLVISNSYGL